MPKKEFSLINKPDFLIIGAGKCGTTSLLDYVSQHPKVFASANKEPNFYSFINSNLSYEEASKRYMTLVHVFSKYSQLFYDAKPGQLLCEASPSYLYSDVAYKNIKEDIPDVKLICIFRQPADRLWSRYLHLLREDRIPSDHFEDCFDKSSIYWHRDDLVPEGFYAKNVKKYLSIFPREQMLFLKFDDFKRDPESVVKTIYNFLGIEEEPLKDVENWNKGGKIKNRFVYDMTSPDGFFRKNFFPGLQKKLKNNRNAKKLVNKIRNFNLIKLTLPDDVRIKITDIYRDDILELQELTGMDLSDWLVTKKERR